MNTTLRIVWDGDAPGLAEHRLSLDAFGPALTELLRAVRRIASGIVRDALGDPEYGSKGGRIAAPAEQIDLEIASLGHGCLQVDFLCRTHVAPGQSFPLFDELPERATRTLIDGIAAESRGEFTNAAARKFLHAMPKGVRKHRYDLLRNGTAIHSCEVSDLVLPDVVVEEPPCLIGLDGTVAGIGFAPPEVKIAAFGRKFTFPASDAQVERAFALRADPVAIMALGGFQPRLLWIKAVGEVSPLADTAARTEFLFSRWNELLSKLAQ